MKTLFPTALLILAPILAVAQTPPVLPPGGLIQLQVAQPAVDISSPVTATAGFDPLIVHAGDKVFYRVSVDATESSVQWPDALPVPAGLSFVSKTSGQITQMQAGRFRPLASFLCELEAAKEGHFSVPSFSVDVSGTPVEIPAANVEVVPKNVSTPAPPRRLSLELSETNVYLGQPFRVRVILPAGPGNEIEALREIEFRGDGLMTDKTMAQQIIEPVSLNGQLRTAFVSEMVVTPIAAGPLEFSVQGFTAGHEFTPPISIRGPMNFSGGPPKYVLLVSDPVQIMVRPLPVESEPPGFTGAIGKFFHDPPRLTTNRLAVGQPVQLKLSFHGEGDLTRFVPPEAPRARDWQIIADPPPATSFTLIPLTDEMQQTPPIPFCYFDPSTGKYVDLTIPSQPVTVVGEGLPAELSVASDEGKSATPIRLTAMASAPGKSGSNLKPLQLSRWFAGGQLIPALGFLALWQWDRRRRYLEAHPEIVRRARARRALRRERHLLQKAASTGDAARFVQHAARAMSVAVAPHYPANPQALVGGDVLVQLPDGGPGSPSAETVKQVFAAADAQFAITPQIQPGLLALQPGVESVLQKLEEKL